MYNNIWNVCVCVCVIVREIREGYLTPSPICSLTDQNQSLEDGAIKLFNMGWDNRSHTQKERTDSSLVWEQLGYESEALMGYESEAVISMPNMLFAATPNRATLFKSDTWKSNDTWKST